MLTKNAVIKINGLLRVLLYLMFAYLMIQFLTYLYYGIQFLTYPHDVNSGEGLIIGRAFSLSVGDPVYTPISAEPFIVMNYTPLFEWIISLFFRILGPTMWVGRSLSILSTIIAGFFIGRIVYNYNENTVAAYIAGFLFFVSGWVRSWSVLCRVDMFAIMLVCIGLYLFTRPSNRMSVKSILWCAIVFLAAIFTRQSLISAPIACFLFVFFKGLLDLDKDADKYNLKTAVKFAVSLIGFGGIITTLFYLFTNGEFYLHTFTYTLDGFSFKQYIDWVLKFLSSHGIIVALSLAYVIYCFIQRRLSVIILFWILAGLVTITASKAGSSINYFIEFWAATCMVMGVILGGALRDTKLLPERFFKNLIIIGLLLVQLIVLSKSTDLSVPDASQIEMGDKIVKYVQEAKGEVLLEYPGYAIQNYKSNIYHPYTMTSLANRGLWDQSKFVQDIESQRFDLIVVSGIGMQYNRWTQEMKEAIRGAYVRVDSVPCFELSYFHYSINHFHVYHKKSNR